MHENDSHYLSDTLAYEVDGYDNICRIGSEKINCGVPSVDSTGMIDIQFSSIFADEKTYALFLRLLNHARNFSDAVTFPYRCDSEMACNFYRLTVSISAVRHVLFFNKLLGTDPRLKDINWSHSFVADPGAFPTCSICNKIYFKKKWTHFQQLVEQSSWPASGEHMYCCSTVCDECECGIDQRIGQSVRSAA